MTDTIVTRLQRESAELRERLDQFRQLLEGFSNLTMLDVIGQEARSRMTNAMSPAEIGPHLREVALRCQTLARESTEPRASRRLQEAAIDLADQAGTLEEIFTIPNPPRGQ